MKGSTKLILALGAAAWLASQTQGHHGHGLLATLDSLQAAPVSGNAGHSRTAWARAELRALGDPRTPADIASLVGWQAAEGGGGANNPLNTTQPAAGSTVFNSVGVQNYPNAAEGVTATAITLRNGYYPQILSALASGNGLCGQSFAELSTWSGGGYSSVC